MKKTILILILVLPVVVVSLVYMIAGFVAREAAVQPINRIHRNIPVMNGYYIFTLGEGRAMATNWWVGKTINLRSFITPQPAPRAQFSALDITLELTNPLDDDGAITITNGVVTVHREIEGLVIIRIDRFFSIEVHQISGGSA